MTVANGLEDAFIGAAIFAATLASLPVINWAFWSLRPPIPTRALAKHGCFVSIDGVDTYYERHGAGPPVLLIPPGGSHTSTWRFNIEPLSRSHEVWVLDLPGSGFTEKPAAFPYTHRAYAVFIRDFMNRLGIARAAIAGQSLGGTVALAFALDFPDRTSGVVLIASGGYSRGGKIGERLGAFNPFRHRLTSEIVASLLVYRAVVRIFDRYVYHNPNPFERDEARIREICSIYRTPNALSSLYRMQKGLDWDFALPDPDRIRTIAVPTLIIWGRQDRVVPLETASRFHADIADSQLVVVDAAGHNVHEERAGAVNDAILAFLASLSARDGRAREEAVAPRVSRDPPSAL